MIQTKKQLLKRLEEAKMLSSKGQKERIKEINKSQLKKKKKLKLLEIKLNAAKAKQKEKQIKKEMEAASNAVAYATRPYTNTPPGWFSHNTIFNKDKRT